MLSYLVSKKSRRKLLEVLWRDTRSGSVRELATAAGISYGSAHGELEAMERAGLAVSEGSAGAAVYRANAAHPLGPLIRELVQARRTIEPPTRKLDNRELRAQLSALGAPLAHVARPSCRAAPEDVIADALRSAHTDTLVARSLPIVIARNRHTLDFDRLIDRARAVREKQALGFFLDLTGHLTGDARLSKIAQRLRDRRITRERDFFTAQRGEYARRLAELRTPALARAWHYRMDISLDSFESLFNKFVASG